MDLPRPALHRIVYRSQAVQDYSVNALLGFCTQFSAANASAGITGLLLSSARQFVQVIEGEHEAIQHLLRRIRMDQRHRDLNVLLDAAAPARWFAEWNMTLLSLPGQGQPAQDALDRLAARLAAKPHVPASRIHDLLRAAARSSAPDRLAA